MLCITIYVYNIAIIVIEGGEHKDSLNSWIRK